MPVAKRRLKGGWLVGLFAGGMAAVAIGYVLVQTMKPVRDPASVAVATRASPAPAVGTMPAATPDGTAKATPKIVAPEAGTGASVAAVKAPPDPTPTAPAFDTVRIDPAGAALVAGRAPAGATVDVLMDGASVGRATAGADGEFATLFDLPPADAPRLMTLNATGTDGTADPSAESVAIAAPAVPAQRVAEATAIDVGPPIAAEPAPPTAVLLTDTGARVLQSAPVVADVSATPDVAIGTIAYAGDGAVMLSGQGAPGSTLRLYLDNASVATLPVPQGGAWSVTLPDVTPGIYTLRADQTDADGKVTARFETPFQREVPERLAAAAGASVAAPLPVDAPAVDAAAGPARPAIPVAVATPVPILEPTAGSAAPTPPVRVTVQPGFTLWRIARENFGDGVMYVKVFDANRDQISNPDLIYPGQVFTVPQAD